MRILVAHDREPVAQELRAAIESCGLNDLLVDIVDDGTSTRRALSRNVYDLLVIDLTLPHIKGSDHPSYSVADNLLRELILLDDLKMPGDTIGITKDVDALERIQTSIGSHVMAVISEDADGRWKRMVSDKVRYASRVANARRDNLNSQYDYDCLIVTALDKELRPFEEYFEFSPLPGFPGAATFAFRDSQGSIRRGAAFAIGKSGEARAASYTQSLISFFRPKLCLMSGICGGVEGKVELGDLIFASSAVDWDYGKWEEAKQSVGNENDNNPSARAQSAVFRSRPGPIPIGDGEVDRIVRRLIGSDFLNLPTLLRNVAQRSTGLIVKPDIHYAPMASGSSVISNTSILMRVRDLNDSIRGIDMECFGFYHASLHTNVIKPAFFCVKSVSDYADGSKGDSYHEGCCYISSQACLYLMGSMWVF